MHPALCAKLRGCARRSRGHQQCSHSRGVGGAIADSLHESEIDQGHGQSRSDAPPPANRVACANSANPSYELRISGIAETLLATRNRCDQLRIDFLQP